MAISNLTTGLRPGVCTSLSRPTAPYEGQQIYETDTDKTLVWNGSAWLYLSTPQASEIGVWETWTPVVTQLGNPTFTTSYARYQRIQKTVFVRARLNITSGGTTNNFLTTTIPIASNDTTGILGSFCVYDSSAATFYNGSAYGITTTTVGSIGDWAGNQLWGVVPNLAIANQDVVWLNLVYEAA